MRLLICLLALSQLAAPTHLRLEPTKPMALPTTNLTLHLDAADTDRLWKERAMSTHPADTEEVLGWDDEADATNFALMSTAGISPVYRAASFNGQGSLDFDGTDNTMIGRTDADGANALISDFITNSAYTIFLSFIMEGDASNSAGSYANTPLYADALGYFGLHLKTNAGTHTLLAYNFDTTDDHADVTISQNTKYVAMVKHVGGNLSIDVNNGALTATVSSGNTGAVSGQLQVGKAASTASYFNGKIGEIAIYNADVTGTDLSDAWAYFTAKWVNTAATAGGPLIAGGSLTRGGSLTHGRLRH